MKKGLVAGIGVASLAAVTVISLSAFAGKPKEYQTQEAAYSSIAENVDVTGDIKGEHSTTYYAEVTAPVSEYSLKVGDTVKENEVVVAYDISDLTKALETALLTAESTENSMNGQIAASDKNASLYNKAVSDYNTYMGLYAVARQSNDQINLSQYQENWDIGEASRSINYGIAEKGVSIADMQTEQAKISKEVSENQEKMTSLMNEMATQNLSDADYNKKQAQINSLEQKNASLTTDLQDVSIRITEAEKSVASGKASLAALPQANLNPEEKAKSTANGNWMEDITRNWTQATTIKNTYEGQILNSYQKEQLQNSYDLSELNVVYAQDDIEKASRGTAVEYNGIVTESFVEKGTVVTKGSPLFSIESEDELKVSVGISKYDIGKIALGQRAVIKIAGHEYDGSVSEIKRLAQVTDSDKAKVDVSVHINNPDEYVYLGLEADVTIFANEVDKALVISSDGYYADDAGDYCYVIEDEVIRKKYITTGLVSDDYVEVLSGINVGDVIITDSVTDDSVGQKAIAK